jgi:phosphocarrier,  HPr family
MIRKNVSIGKGVGTDSRPVAILVQTASKFKSSIHIETEEKKVNVKSIMGLMTLPFAEGLSMMLEADGEDEVAAVEAISAYLVNS